MTILEEAISLTREPQSLTLAILLNQGRSSYAVEARNESAEITRQIVESGVDVILGGESDYLPEGVEDASVARTDGLNLIERAR